MEVAWNSKAALWQQALVDAMKVKFKDCKDKINDSDLGYSLDGDISTHFGYNFENKGIAFKITDLRRDKSSDKDNANGEKYLWIITASISVRIYFSNIASVQDEQEYQTAISNLVSNYINDIKIIETTITDDEIEYDTGTWESFATGREHADVGWYDGGFGTQLELTCKSKFTQ